jgi:putative ubiquitin-RnfH superfamily antitoxin RatB of RatAB toxin-antitoxin module
MSGAPRKRCTVAYATPQCQDIWTVELDAGATVADAIASVRASAGAVDVPWDRAPVGIFGEPCERSAVPRDGDRIELYRPLSADPKESRRDRVRRARAAARSGR